MKLAHVALLSLLAAAGCLDPSEAGNLVPKTVEEDPALPAIEINGARLHAETYGKADAPVIMVLHGGPGGDYRGLLPLAALADDGYQVVFWDQRGAGLSQRFDASELSTDQYLEDLRLVVDHYTAAGQPLVFIGHSWGAMYATWFIDTYGDYGGKIRGAVLSEPGAFTWDQLEAYFKRLNASIEIFGEQLGDIAWAEQFMSPSDHARADYLYSLRQVGGLPADHKDPNNPRPFWRSGAIASAELQAIVKRDGFDWTRNLAAFQRDVVFIRGDLNTAATLEAQQELAASYPHAELVTIQGVGHQMIWERPTEYLADVRAYLAKISFGGAR